MIAAARAELAAVLATVAPTWPAWPAPLTLPALVITEPETGFITEDTYGHAAVTFDVLAMVRAGDAATMVANLDQLTDDVLTATGGLYGWAVTGYRTITGPDQQPILTTTLTLTTSKELTP